MKVILLILGLGIAVAQKYSSENDNFDVSELLRNDRLLKNYIRCLLDEGPCTPEVRKVKEHLNEALKTRCAKCTDRQKEIIKKLIPEVKKKHPELWEKLIAKYDPQGKHRAAFSEYL